MVKLKLIAKWNQIVSTQIILLMKEFAAKIMIELRYLHHVLNCRIIGKYYFSHLCSFKFPIFINYPRSHSKLFLRTKSSVTLYLCIADVRQMISARKMSALFQGVVPSTIFWYRLIYWQKLPLAHLNQTFVVMKQTLWDLVKTTGQSFSEHYFEKKSYKS